MSDRRIIEALKELRVCIEDGIDGEESHQEALALVDRALAAPRLESYDRSGGQAAQARANARAAVRHNSVVAHSTLNAVIVAYLRSKGFSESVGADGRSSEFSPKLIDLRWSHPDMGTGSTLDQAVTWQIGREQTAAVRHEVAAEGHAEERAAAIEAGGLMA